MVLHGVKGKGATKISSPCRFDLDGESGWRLSIDKIGTDFVCEPGVQVVDFARLVWKCEYLEHFSVGSDDSQRGIHHD
jgi:hypothetical protein